TRLGIGIADAAAQAMMAGWLIGMFVLGVMAGSYAGFRAGPRRPAAILLLVAFLLTCAALLGGFGYVGAAVTFLALAMGAENATFERNGEVSVGLTYMTGALVKLGQRLTLALLGGNRWEWVPYAGLWLGLVMGAVGGASAASRIGLDSLWPAAVFAALLALAAGRIAETRGTENAPPN
ncbi:MAG TPA: DUF1275 family protein, partial [Allosphingosinicella sp.]